MAHVGEESLTLIERGNEWPDGYLVDLSDTFALTAHQVHVVGVLGQVVRGRAVVQVAVLDQAKLLEQLERPVDSRDVDTAGGLANLAVDLLRRGVLQPGDSLQNELALGGDAVAASPEGVIPRLLGHEQSLVTPGE